MSIKKYTILFSEKGGAHEFAKTVQKNKGKKHVDYRVGTKAESYFQAHSKEMVADFRTNNPNVKRSPKKIKEMFIESVQATKVLNAGMTTDEAIRKVRYSRTYMSKDKQKIQSTRDSLKKFGFGLNQTKALQYSNNLRQSSDRYTGEYIGTGKYAGNIVIILHGVNGQSIGLGFDYNPELLKQLGLM